MAAGGRPWRFNPFTPEFRAHPHADYARLREESPVHWSFMGCWVLASHADVSAVLKDASGFAADRRWDRYARRYRQGSVPAAATALQRLQALWIVFSDPPAHTRLRTLIGRALTPSLMGTVRERVRERVRASFDAIARQAEGGDLVAELAFPLPVEVISTLLGIPHAQRDSLRDWSSQLGRTFDPVLPAAAAKKGVEAADAFWRVIEGLVAQRRRAPEGDLISGLLQAEDHGDRLTDDEVIANCIFLYGAGHETTTSSIAAAVYTLLRHPDALAQLKAKPELLGSAVEELLRFESPVQFTTRVAARDAQLGGQQIAAGDEVMLLIGSANRDAAAFERPDELALHRSPNPHLAFGQGIHYCMGAVLARLQLQEVLRALAEEPRAISLGAQEPRWREHIVLRGLERLSLRYGTAATGFGPGQG